MARKYKIHRYYSVVVWTTKGKVNYDDLTLREAKQLYINIKLNKVTYYKEIVRRLYAEHKSVGVINLETL